MGNIHTRHHHKKRHHHSKRHHHKKRHVERCRSKRAHKGGQGSPLNPTKKISSSLLKTRKKERDNLSLGDKLLRNKGEAAYSKAKRSEYIEKLKKQRTEQFRKQKESFLSGNTPSEKRKSI